MTFRNQAARHQGYPVHRGSADGRRPRLRCEFAAGFQNGNGHTILYQLRRRYQTDGPRADNQTLCSVMLFQVYKRGGSMRARAGDNG